MLCGSYAQGSTSSMAEEGSVFELERFQKQLESLLSRYPSDELQADSKPFCSDFCKLVEEYTSHWQVPLPQLRILEMALCYFVRASSFFSSNCDHVLHTLSSLALSVFELLLFFDQKDFHQDPLKHFTVTFQECHLAIAKHQNVHFHQVKNLVQGGGPWASSALQAILAESNLPQNEVDGYISSELPVFFELRVRYLFTCERVSEAVALAKCCARHPTAGQHLFFLQVYLTWLYKTSQHDHLLKEVADLNGKDAVHIICSLESEETDEVLLALSRAFLSQQLCRGDMYYLWDLVLIWSKLHSRLNTSKQAFLEESHQLMLSATNVNSIFPFIRVILEELDEDGFQFCVELCANALQSCLPCDVVTKSLIYKTIASLLPNDLEVCRACALLVFFLERTVEAYKMVYLLYTHPDQEYHAETSPIGNHVRFETLQVLKKGLYFDPEFWNLIALRTNCLKLMSEKVVSAALEEIMEEKWVPNYCTKEPTFRSNPCQKGAKVTQQAGSKKRNHKEDVHHKEDKNHMAPKRIKMCPGKTQMSDHGAKKKGNQGSRSMKEASSESFRRSFWQLDKRQENLAWQCSYGEHRRITRLSEKNPPKRKIRKPRWLMEDSGTLEENNASPKVKKHVMKPQHQKQNRTAVVKRSTSGQVKNNTKHKTSVNSHLKAKENVAKHQKGFSVGCLKPPSPAHVILELSQPENELMGTFTEDTCNRQRGYPQMLLYKPTVKLPFTAQPVKTVHRKEVVLRARDTSTFVQQLHCYARRQKGKGVSNIQASVSTITRSSVQGSSPKVPSGELCEKPLVEMKVTIASQTQAGSKVTQSPILDKVSQAQAQTIEKVSEPKPSAEVSHNLAVDSIAEMVANNDVSPLTQSPVLDMVSQAQPAEEVSQTTPSAEVSQNLSADSMSEMVATNNISALSQSPVLDMISQAQTTVEVSETTPSAQSSQNSVADTIAQMVPTDDVPPILTAERISNIGAMVQIGSESWDDIARQEESSLDGNSGQKFSLFSIPPETGKNPLAQSTANTPNAFVTIMSTSGIDNLTETMAYTTPNDTKRSNITANSSTSFESAVLEISAKKSKEPMPCKDSVRMDTDTITIQKETIPVENSGIPSETSEAEATCVPKEMRNKEDLCALTLVTEMVTELEPAAFVQDTECPKEPIKEDSASEEVTPVLEGKPDVPSEILTTSSCSVTEQGATVIADIQEEGGSEGIALEMSVNGDPMVTPQESEESKLEYCCTLCNKVFKGKRVIVHAMVHYRRDKCMFCGMLFKDDLLAMMHLSEHIDKLKKSKEPASNKGQENCISESQEICTPRTSTKAETTNSSTVHHRGRPRKPGARPKCLNLSDSSPSESRIQLRSSRNSVDVQINKKEQNMSVCSTSKSRVHKVNGHIGKTQGVLMRDKQDTLNFKTMEGLTQLEEISYQERGNDEAEKLLLPETGDLEGGVSTTPIQIENKLICFTEDKVEKTESFKLLKNDTKQDKRAAVENTVETQKKVCCPVNGCAWYSDLSRNRVALLYHALEDHYGDVKPLELAFRIGNSKCGVCMRVLWSFQHYQHHVERHRLTPRHPCLHQGCSARFKTGIEMRRHTRRHSPLQAVCCLPGCSQLFICLWALNLHEREHYASKPTQTVKEAILQMGNKGNNMQVVKKQGRKPKDGTAVMPVNTVNCNQSIKGSHKLGNPVMGAPVTTATTALVTEALKLRNQPKNSNVMKNHSNKGPSAHPTITARRFRQKLRKEQLKKSLSIPKTRKVLSSIAATNGNVRNRLKKKQVKVNLKGHKTKGCPPGSAKLKNALFEDKAGTNQKDDTAEEKTDLLKGQNSHTPAQRPSSPSETKRASKVSSEPKTEEEKSQQIKDLVKTTCTDSILELRESKSKSSPKKQIKKNHVKHKDVSDSIFMPADTGNSLHELAPQPTTSAEETQKTTAKGNTKKLHVTKKCCVGKERNATTAPVNSSKTQNKHKVKDPGTQSTSKKPKSKTTVQQGNPGQAKTTVDDPAGDVKEEMPPSIVTNLGDSVVENGQEVGVATPLDSSKANKKLKVNNATGDPKIVKKKRPSKDPGIPSTSKKPVMSKTVVPQFKPGEAKMVVEESVGEVGKTKGETPDPAFSHGDSLLENGQVGNITAPLDASKANKKHKVRNTTGDPKIVKKKRPSKDSGTPSASKKPKSKTTVQQGKPGEAKTTVEGPASEVGKVKKETSAPTGANPGDYAIENGQVAGITTPFDASKANKKHKVRNTTGDPKIVKKKHPSKDPGTPSISKKHEPKTPVQQVEPSEAKAVIAEDPAGGVGKEQVEPPPSTMASPGYSAIENGQVGDIKEPQKPQVRVANVEDEKAKPAPTDCHLPYGKRPYIRLPPTAYLDEKFTTMPKRRKEMSMFFHSSEDNLSSQQASTIAPPQRQRCANCFVTFSSAAELQTHLQLKKCSNLFGFDSDDEGN